MRNNFFVLALLIAGAPAQAQQSRFSGEVSIINSQTETGKRQYVSNAAVEEAFGQSQATITDANGFFRLVLVGLDEHANFQFTVQKSGLEVVNTDALQAVVNQREPAKVYMAAPGKIADYRKKYYNIGKTAAERALEERLKTLQAERSNLKTNEKANEKRIRELETALAQAEAQRKKINDAAKELASRYAPINLDDTAPLYREAFSFFQKGDLEQAIVVLQQANYAQQVQKILQERDTINADKRKLERRDSVQMQRTQETLQGLSLQADLYKTTLAFDSATVCYEIMLRLDSSNLQVLRQYASFLAHQNQYDKAIIYYKKALLLAQTEDVKAAIYNSLGNAYRAVNQMKESGDAYSESLRLFRNLSEKNRPEYAPYMALTLNNLGNYYRKTQDDNRFDEAESAFKEALAIYQQLEKTKKGEYQAYIALTLNNLGRVYYEMKRMREAKRSFEASLDIYERLSEKNPNAIVPGDIQEFVDLSLSYDDHDKRAYIFDKYSESLLNRALAVHRKMAEKNPSTFLPFVALTLNNLGHLYANHYKETKAEEAYKEALSINRGLAEQNPNAFYPFVALTLRSLGGFYEQTGKKAESQAALEEAASIEGKYGGKK